MIRTFRYRLNPTHKQATTLVSWLKLTRDLYNAALQERKEAWGKQRHRVTKYDQQQQIPWIRTTISEYVDVPVIVLRGAIYRLDRAFQAFFRRCKSGAVPGYPRFKGVQRWNSIEIEDLSKIHPIVAGGKRVKIPLLGKVRLKYSRPLEGRPRTMKLKLDSDGHWYVSIVCDSVEPKLLPAAGKPVGVDLGVRTFAATSDSETFENPRALRSSRLSLKRAHRRLSRRKKGTKRYEKAAKLLAKKHAHVANVRREHHILVAKYLVAKYDTICVEELSIDGMAKKWFAKPIYDAAWGEFLKWLDCKAESAGRTVVKVDPAGTSDVCSQCGDEVKKTLAVHTHQCLKCGLVLDRDINAAINILALGRRVQGEVARKNASRRSAEPAVDPVS